MEDKTVFCTAVKKWCLAPFFENVLSSTAFNITYNELYNLINYNDLAFQLRRTPLTKM